MSSRLEIGPIKVAGLVPYPPGTTPSQRYRIEQWIDHLDEQGISVDLFPFADQHLLDLLKQPGARLAKATASIPRFLHRFVDLSRVREYDVVLVHRALCLVGPAVLERILTLLGRPVIFDFDDAIFLLHKTAANRHLAWLKFPGKTSTICRLSSHVVVGNSFLAEYARKHNSRVTVIPTSVDTSRFKPQTRREPGERVILGWTGSSTSQTYLEMFVPVLREILANVDVEFRVHSDRRPELGDLRFEWRKWSPETEIEEIGSFDIGIMPMPDDDWARGKCAMKALLYMSMGIPAVCSAVGANREVITHSENGFLATSTGEWISSIRSLVDSDSLRQKLGSAGRKTVETHYSMQSSADLFAKVVRDTVSRRESIREVDEWESKKSRSNER